MHAYCWRSGLIEFGKTVPDGALPLIRGREKAVRDRMSAVARHSRKSEALFVPGIPEAVDDEAAASAYETFVAWTTQMGRP